MKAPHYNYMKYWRVVRRYAFQKYDLSQQDLDILFYIHDEHYFSNYQFEKFERLFSWSLIRLHSLTERGWINKLGSGNKYGKRDVYEETMKTQRVVTGLYKILNGEGFPDTSQRMMHHRRRYMDRRYRKFIGDMVDEIKETKKKNAEFKAEVEKQRLRDERIRKTRGQ
jgi:hypothetical protein